MRNYSKSVSTAIYFLPSPQNIIKKFYTVSVSAFSFYLKKKMPAKEKQTRGSTPRPRGPGNAAPQYTACDSQSDAQHIRPQTRRSLNGCGLVRLAAQAVRSLSSISYRTLRRGYQKLDYQYRT
jgi:hypothetical protein